MRNDNPSPATLVGHKNDTTGGMAPGNKKANPMGWLFAG